jgi:ferredoxin
MAMVGKCPKLSLAEQFYLPAIAAGPAITLKHLKKLVSGNTKVTMQYPEQRWDSQITSWYRGAPALVKDEHGKERCVARRLCEFICPPRAITIVPKEIPLGSLGKGREAPQRVRDRHDPPCIRVRRVAASQIATYTRSNPIRAATPQDLRGPSPADNGKLHHSPPPCRHGAAPPAAPLFNATPQP